MKSIIVLLVSNLFLVVIFIILVSIYLRNGHSSGKKVEEGIKKIKAQISGE